jgi:glutaredoxin
MNKINLFTLTNCHHCKNAKQLLADEINTGAVLVQDSSFAPKNVNGFPHFTYKNKSFTGYPHTKDKLYNELSYTIEKYHGLSVDSLTISGNAITKNSVRDGSHYEIDNMEWVGVM